LTAPEFWTLEEARTIADQAVKRGWSYENLVFHIQSRACRQLLVAMSVSAPSPSLIAPPGHRQLQVVRASDGQISGGAGRYDIVPLWRTDVVVLREIASWLEPERLVACRRPIGSERPPVCSAANPREPETLTPEHFLFATRYFPEIHRLDLPQPYIATYEIPV